MPGSNPISEGEFSLESIEITPELREFLRAELAQVITFDAPDGDKWTPYSISLQIENDDENPGGASDDALRRFLNEASSQRTQRRTLIGVAAFLISFEFVSTQDIRYHSQRGYSRAASALAQAFGTRNEDADIELSRSLLGEYRSYKMIGEAKLSFVNLVIASPDQGQSITVSVSRTLYRIQELEWFKDETNDLDPAAFHEIADLLQEPEGVVDSHSTARGVAIFTDWLLCIVAGDAESSFHSLFKLDEVHTSAGRVRGLRAVRQSGWISMEDGVYMPPEAHVSPTRTLDPSEVLEFYPQGIVVEALAKFDEDFDDVPEGKERGRPLTLLEVAKFEKMLKDAERIERREKNARDIARATRRQNDAFSRCTNQTQRLAVAISFGAVEEGLAAIRKGADVNAIHPSAKGLPMLHMAASWGMRELVRAMIAKKNCDLTVRDRCGRLASTCADNNAQDFALRDELIKAQNAQFRDQGIDPRNPKLPNYGKYLLEPT